MPVRPPSITLLIQLPSLYGTGVTILEITLGEYYVYLTQCYLVGMDHSL